MTSEPENTRLSSPVSGTDMVMVPRTLAEKLAKFATEWDRWQAKGSTSTERMVTFSYGQARIGLDDFRAVHALLSASPSTPIPVIAEAGERELRDVRDVCTDDQWEALFVKLHAIKCNPTMDEIALVMPEVVAIFKSSNPQGNGCGVPSQHPDMPKESGTW